MVVTIYTRDGPPDSCPDDNDGVNGRGWVRVVDSRAPGRTVRMVTVVPCVHTMNPRVSGRMMVMTV